MSQDPLTHELIGHAMAAHSALGPGLLEEFYHQDLVGRLTRAGIEHLSKPRRDLIYRGITADTFEADIVCQGKFIAELKSLRTGFDKEHFTQILCYQKFWMTRIGVLLDFGKPSLVPKRMAYSSKLAKFELPVTPLTIDEIRFAKSVIEAANECLAEIGLGYRESTWVGLMSAALQSAQIPFSINPAVNIGRLGTTSLKCFVIDGKMPLSVTALGDEVTAIDRAQLQTCLRWLDLPWGMALHFGKTKTDVKFITAPNSNRK